MISNNDLEILFQWNLGQHETIDIFLADHPGEESSIFEKLAASLEAAAPKIHFPDRKKTVVPAFKRPLPGFVLKDNILYSALPLEKELAPFLQGLTGVRSPFVPADLAGQLDKISIPCTLTLFIASQCPHCPAAVNAIFPLAAYSDKIQLHVIDGTLFPEIAEQKHVMSSPCLLLDDDDFRWTGTVQPLEIVDMILNRDTSRLGSETLKKILEDGKAQWLAGEMIRKGKWFPNFPELLIHETLGVRLGALVVVEEIAGASPGLAQELAPFCMEKFHQNPLPVQGDLLYALGLVGGTDAKNWLENQIQTIENPELKEAAKDALEQII